MSDKLSPNEIAKKLNERRALEEKKIEELQKKIDETQTMIEELSKKNIESYEAIMNKPKKYSGEVMFPRIPILKLCKSLHVRCAFRPVIPKEGFGNLQFDFGVYKNRNEFAFLIEYDGPYHYDLDVVNQLEITYGFMANVKKAKAIATIDIPVLHLTPDFLPVLPDLLRVWVWQFIDDWKIRNKYISMILMYDKYGWTTDYIPHDIGNDRVNEFLKLRNDFIEKNGKINFNNWYEFYKTIKPFKF